MILALLQFSPWFKATLLNPDFTQQIQDIYGNSTVARVSLGYGDSVTVEPGMQFLVHCPSNDVPSGYGFHSVTDYNTVSGLHVYEYSAQQTDERDKTKSGKARWSGKTYGYDVNDDLDLLKQGGVYLVSANGEFEFSCAENGLGSTSSAGSTGGSSSSVISGPTCVLFHGGTTVNANSYFIPACPAGQAYTCPSGYNPSCLQRSVALTTKTMTITSASCTQAGPNQSLAITICGSYLVPSECSAVAPYDVSCSCTSGGNPSCTTTCGSCMIRTGTLTPFCQNPSSANDQVIGSCTPIDCSTNHDACAGTGLACNTFTGRCDAPCTGQGNICGAGESCDTGTTSANLGKCITDCTISGAVCPSGTTCNTFTKLCQ